MGGKKVTIVIDADDFLLLEKRAKSEGFGRVSGLARYLIVNGINNITENTEDVKTLQVKVENYKEISAYVKEKKFGKPEYFAAYAMEYYMNKNQLTAAQKARLGKNVENLK